MLSVPFPSEKWRKIMSINPYEDLSKDINRHTCVIGIFPTDAVIIRLVETLLLVQQVEWQLDKHRVLRDSRRPNWLKIAIISNIE